MTRSLSLTITWVAAAIASVLILVFRWGSLALDNLAIVGVAAFFVLILCVLTSSTPRGTVGTMGLGVLGLLLLFIVVASISWISALAAQPVAGLFG